MHAVIDMVYVAVRCQGSIFCDCGGFEKSRLGLKREFRSYSFDQASSLLAAGVLGDSLCALRDGVLGELAGEVEPDSGLDFTTRDGVLLVVVSQTGGLGGDTLEDVAHEGVHDAHGLGGDTSVGVDLLQHLVDVDGVALLAGLSALLGFARWLALDGGFLLAFLGSNFARHGRWTKWRS